MKPKQIGLDWQVVEDRICLLPVYAKVNYEYAIVSGNLSIGSERGTKDEMREIASLDKSGIYNILPVWPF